MRHVWRVHYVTGMFDRTIYTTDRGLARRTARHCRVVGWPVTVNRVALACARREHSWDPFAMPFRLTPPGQVVQSNTSRRRSLRWIAHWDRKRGAS